MKKFLSLVLALAMTVSLFTISAGATEYKDLSDKSDIQYSEAVAVLNKIGIITGYTDGSFKPANSLTRGAAAKIIVSLMIGSTAASNLSVSTAPFKDVAASSTFASYISYCKTAGYISGYSDGTFRPTATLSGYAFEKMLLGALGYKSDVEHFTGSGWTMNVARIGNVAGLQKGISGFTGNAAVTRETACQLALNTLKATEVEYSGNDVSVTTGSATVVVGNTQRTNVVNSNGTDYQAGVTSGTQFTTMQFCEEHFSDLKLASTSTTDSFGRPANQWSYKNVTIGKYAKSSAFSYTASMVKSSDSTATKVSKLGLDGYKLAGATVPVYTNGSGVATTVSSVAAIGDLTANGTLVEVFTNSTTADQIDSVVVIKTQIMQVNSVSSSSVTLKQVESTGKKVDAVKSTDSCYSDLSGLKADDYVLITPVKASGDTSYSVSSVAVPSTATGSISQVSINSSAAVTGLTVGGTAYSLSENWTAEDGQSSLNTSSVNSTITSSVYTDSYGYAIYVKNVKASTNYILYTGIYNNLVDGKIIKMAQGYDMSGNALSLNLGTAAITATAGTVYTYTSTTKSDADYTLGSAVSSTTTAVASGAATLGSTGLYFDSGVKFLFVTKDTDGDISGVTVKDGVQKVTSAALQYVVKSGKITAVIIPNDSDVEVSTNVLYISALTGTTLNSSSKPVSVFTAYIDGQKQTSLVASKTLSSTGFYTYSVDGSGIYTVKAYDETAAATSKTTAVMVGATLNRYDIINNTYATITGTTAGTLSYLNAKNAVVIDLSSGNNDFSSLKDLYEATTFNNYTVAVVYNNNSTTSTYKTVSYLFVTSHSSTAYTFATAAFTGATAYTDSACTDAVADGASVYEGQTLYCKVGTSLFGASAVTNGTALALTTAPTAATGAASYAVYSFRVSGGAPGAVTTAVAWYTVAAPAITSPTTGTAAATYPASDFSVVASKTIGQDNDTITFTITSNGSVTDTNDTFTFTPSATSGADGAVAAATGLTGIAPGKTWTCTLDINAANVAAPVIAIAATTV